MLFSVLSAELRSDRAKEGKLEWSHSSELTFLIESFLTNTSECDPGSDLRAVHDDIEFKVVVLKVAAECPITNFSKDGTGDIDTEHAFNLPHQVEADAEPSDLATYGGVIRLVKIVTGAQSDIRIEPVIVF